MTLVIYHQYQCKPRKVGVKSETGAAVIHPSEKNVIFGTEPIDCNVRYRFGNPLRFPRARDEPPHSQITLAVGSHRLRFPAGVFVYFLR